jgi:hypothetical protein
MGYIISMQMTETSNTEDRMNEKVILAMKRYIAASDKFDESVVHTGELSTDHSSGLLGARTRAHRLARSLFQGTDQDFINLYWAVKKREEA